MPQYSHSETSLLVFHDTEKQSTSCHTVIIMKIKTVYNIYHLQLFISLIIHNINIFLVKACGPGESDELVDHE